MIQTNNFSDASADSSSALLTARTGRAAPRPSGLALSNWPRWMQERARRLNRNFISIEARMERGETFKHVVGQFAWWYRNKRKFYRCEPQRRIRFSANTLIRLFYIWRASGRTLESLGRKHGGRRKLDDGQVIAFARACVEQAGQSMRAAHGYLACLARLKANRGKAYMFPHPMASDYAYRHALPKPVLKAVIAVFATRRVLSRQVAEAKGLIEAFASGGRPS